MTTRQRLDLLARAYPRLFPRAELLRLLRTQLGHVDALDTWIRREGVRVRARAPGLIYHVCAGNLAVSASTSLMHGLLLGSHNIMKLPSEREDSTARREILDFIRGLPSSLRKLVETHRALDLDLFRRADVIVAFGSDATINNLRAQARWDQKFIAHGHAVSLLWIAEPDHLTPREARACAVDVLTYDQLGCLSPQAIYLPLGADIEKLGDKLALALEKHWQQIAPKPARPLSVAARIGEARDVAQALGHRIWLPPKKHFGWTLIHDVDPAFQPSPIHGVIYLRQVAESRLGHALAPVAGRISTVGIAGQLPAGRTSSRLEKTFLSLGVSRFCAAGHMQFPPLTWHHDGHSSLGDLVAWIDFEPFK
ncbi:MAG TPA: acyl-CoA reductase [Candidatus Methylacidiphilales bacterium]